MMKIETPTREEVAQVISDTVKNGDLEQWSKRIINSAIKHLKENPDQYRNYGPYWWTLKKAIVESGFGLFGEDYDAEMVDAVSQDGDNPFALFLSMIYYDYSMENMFIGQSNHMIAVDGEDREYIISDNDIERYIAAKSMVKG